MANGGMAERSKAVVLKTAELSGSVGSNPTPSAKVLFGGAELDDTRHQPRDSSDFSSA